MIGRFYLGDICTNDSLKDFTPATCKSIFSSLIYLHIHICRYHEMTEADFFKCLSDPTRLQILKMVVSAEEVCVCTMTEGLGLSQPKISRHLATLRSHGLVRDERKGQWVYYRLHDNVPAWAKDILHIALAQIKLPQTTTRECQPS